MASKRVLVIVTRTGSGTNLTDKTPTIVWDHEIPILAEIHGESAIDVISDPEGLLDPTIVKNRAAQIEHLMRVSKLGSVFDGDSFEEYQRLTMKYGMHPEVKMSNVEKVYGSYSMGRFSDRVGTKDVGELSMGDLRDMLDAAGIEYRSSDKKPALVALVRNLKAESAEAAGIAAKSAERAA